MLVAWMIYTLVVSALMGLAGLAVERSLAVLGQPVRWVWPGALVLALFVSAAPWMGWEMGPAPLDPGGVEVGAPAPVAGALLPWLPASIKVSPEGALARLDAPLAWGWAGVVTALLGWLGFSGLRLRRRLRRWSWISLHGERVLVSAHTGPALVGVLENRMVLPRWCLELPRECRELVLAHEDEHRRAGDTRLVFAVGMAAFLLPWNLPFWWMLRRAREAVEVDCDARVLRRFPRRRRLYGELLLLVCSRKAAPSGALATFSERRSTLGRRISMLTRLPEEQSVRRALLLSVGGGLLIVVACLVPGPDQDLPGITGPEEEAALADAAAERRDLAGAPAFTPYEVEPEVLNVPEIQEALEREYPSVLRDAGIGGVVILYFFIDEAGVVRNALVNQTSGHPALDEAAKRVAGAFRFSPALNRGEEVPVWVSIPIRFTTG